MIICKYYALKSGTRSLNLFLDIYSCHYIDILLNKNK